MRPLCLALVVLAGTAHADAQRRGRPLAERGDVALIAEVSGIDDLRLLSALGGVGVRYRVADRVVLGTSVGVNAFDGDRDADRESEAGGQDVSDESSSFSGRVTVWAERHVRTRQRAVSPFVGGGLQIAASTQEATTTQAVASCPTSPCPPFTRSSERESLAVGAGVFAGVEVKLARGVSLGGAYTLGAEYTTAETRLETDLGGDVERDTFDERFWTVGTGISRLVLSVYF